MAGRSRFSGLARLYMYVSYLGRVCSSESSRSWAGLVIVPSRWVRLLVAG